MESLQKRPAPYSYRILREIEDKVRQNGELVNLCEELRQGLKGEAAPARSRAHRKLHENMLSVKGMAMKKQIGDWDVIVSSYGRHPMELKRQSEAGSPPESGPAPLNETKAAQPYRQFYPERM